MNYFPTYLASGNAFCNRKDELKRIIYDLKGGTPILLMSPRRYGKTSLALKAFGEIKWPYSHVDLYKALSEEDIVRFILNGIGQLLGKLESTPKKLMNIAGEFFSNLSVKVVFEKMGVKLEFDSKKKHYTDIILKSLENLNSLSSKKNKKIILFLDEFQVLGEVIKNNSIEAIIREAAQKSTHVRYVFSGSNRHLMEQMFEDRSRPFYKLCDHIKLQRIKEIEYEKYIQKAATLKWKNKLSNDSLRVIFETTEYHSYYINKLCSLLWQQSKIPSRETILITWKKFALENKSPVERELSLLSINQRKILIVLSKEEGVCELFGKKMIQNLNLNSSSIQRAIEPLIEKDYVFMDENKNYKVLDPLIKSILN